MAVRLQRKIRRILAAIHTAQRPLTGLELADVTCHGPGTLYPALDRLMEAGWIERRAVAGGHLYEITDTGLAAAGLPAGQHRYLSTGCVHGDHGYCKGMTGLNGAKRPGECKHCGARCVCSCHQP